MNQNTSAGQLIFFACLGTILGSIVFTLIGLQVLFPAIAAVLVSALALTTLAKYRSQLLTALIFFVLVSLNYGLRNNISEYREDLSNLVANEDSYLVVLKNKGSNAFYQDELILELKKIKPSFKDIVQEFFVPIRFLAKTKSSQALREGDTVNLQSKVKILKLNSKQRSYNLRYQTFYQIKNKDIVFVDGSESWLQKLQQKIQNYYQKYLSDDNSKLVLGMFLGSQVVKLPYRLAQKVRAIGIGHFFAASGFHVLLIVLIFSFLLKPMQSEALKNLIIIILVFIYAGLAGFSPSVMRAALMFTLYIIATGLGRTVFSLKLLIVLAGFFLLIDPFTIFDLGFQFSYLATASILLWYKPIKTTLGQYITNHYLLDLISVSVAVQLLLLPILIYYFNAFHLWSLVANLVFSPVVSVLMFLTATGLHWLVDWTASLTTILINFFAKLPGASLELDFNFNSLVLLTALINLLAYSLVEKEHIYRPESNDFAINLKNKFLNLVNDLHMQRALFFSFVLLLVAINAPGFQAKAISFRNGNIIDCKECQNFTASAQKLAYIKIPDTKLEALFIKDLSSIAQIDDFQFKQVDLLVLPKLRANDIYLDTVLDLIKPQFILTSSSSKAKRSLRNLQTLSRKAHTILDSGTLYISKDKYWHATS